MSGDVSMFMRDGALVWRDGASGREIVIPLGESQPVPWWRDAYRREVRSTSFRVAMAFVCIAGTYRGGWWAVACAVGATGWGIGLRRSVRDGSGCS